MSTSSNFIWCEWVELCTYDRRRRRHQKASKGSSSSPNSPKLALNKRCQESLITHEQFIRECGSSCVLVIAAVLVVVVIAVVIIIIIVVVVIHLADIQRTKRAAARLVTHHFTYHTRTAACLSGSN